eukprot:5964772-Prorocentrum_lima.AAC.1
MQRDLDNRLLAEQTHQARALIEAISGHMREQQRAQEVDLTTLHDEYHREHMHSHSRMNIM